MSRRFCLFRPFWPCVPLLGVFPGCHSGPRAVLGFSLDLLRPFSWDARRQGSSCVSFVLFFFFPFCFAATPFLERSGVASLTRRVVLPTPRRSDSQGTAHFWAGALLAAPFLRNFVGIFCCLWGQGPTDAWRPGPFCVGRGPFACPLTGPFHTARFFPPRFFLFFFRPLGPRLPRIACWSLAFCFVFIPRGAVEWLARVDCTYTPCTAVPRIPRQYSRATPKIPRKTRRLPSPVFCLDFL